ncbi:MAG: hypothetical protein LBE59_00095 [Nevskiaceae bacterium]|jgi:hypothetical protein|nr:hypothetical protein [Nevskiaceae bacterium]
MAAAAKKRANRLALLGAAACALCVAMPLYAQRPPAGNAPPATPKAAAPIDLTGYWVSVITEDWKFRMVTPNAGVVAAIPLNPQGQQVARQWDPAKDEAAGEQCRAYGAGGVMRIPGRLHVQWQGEDTLQIDTDAGTQTRLLRFRGGAPSGDAPSWQGNSSAQWNAAGRSLKVVTNNLKPGYLRSNGAPYSDKAVVTEYYDLNELPNGDQWLTITTKVDDPVYLTRPYLTSSDFKKLPGAAGWNPTPCSAG